jgi:hypothetical protein
VIAQQPVVQLRDASGASVAQAGIAITLSIGSGTGTLSGTATVNTDAIGKATFTDLVITGASTNTLAAVATGLTGVTSSSITVSSSGFSNPDLMWSGWGGTTLQNSGLLANGNQWDTDTQGHVNQTPIANPTGVQPWSGTNNKVIDVTYDPSADSNAGILVLPDLAHTPFKLGYGSTHYTAFWIYVTAAGTIGSSTLRKWLYERWDSGHGSSGDPDHVCRGFGAQIGGETDSATSQLWNSNTANSLVTIATWHYIEVKTVCDSAKNAGDGKVTMWFDDETTPILQDVTIAMTTPSSASGALWFLDWVRIGAQLELGATGEHRYIGPAAMSTTRIGKPRSS